MIVFKQRQWRVNGYGQSKVIPLNDPVIPEQDDDLQDKVEKIDFKRDELSIPIHQKRYRPSVVDLSKQRINSRVAENVINRPHFNNNNVQDEEDQGIPSTKWENETSLDNDESNRKIDFGDEINVTWWEKDNAKDQAQMSKSNSYLVNTQYHIPSQIQPTAKKKYPQRRCVICKENGKPRDCRYYCKACVERPALCKSRCFRKYHCNI